MQSGCVFNFQERKDSINQTSADFYAYSSSFSYKKENPNASPTGKIQFGLSLFLVGVSLKDLSFPVTIYQIEAQRSGFDLERRSSGMSAL